MLQLDPKQRMTAEEVLAHPWVKGSTASDRDLSHNIQGIKRSVREGRRRRSLRGAPEEHGQGVHDQSQVNSLIVLFMILPRAAVAIFFVLRDSHPFNLAWCNFFLQAAMPDNNPVVQVPTLLFVALPMSSCSGGASRLLLPGCAFLISEMRSPRFCLRALRALLRYLRSGPRCQMMYASQTINDSCS